MAEEQVRENTSPEGADAATQTDALEQARKQAAEYKDNWLRAVADLQNYRKRVERERAEMAEWANASLIARLLEVLDGFDAAFNAIPEKFKTEPWLEGIRLVDQKLKTILTQEKVKPIEAVGKQFDPNYHEAMWQEETSEHTDGEVMSEFQRGYMLGERVLRPARVKIAKATGGTDGSGQRNG